MAKVANICVVWSSKVEVLSKSLKGSDAVSGGNHHTHIVIRVLYLMIQH